MKRDSQPVRLASSSLGRSTFMEISICRSRTSVTLHTRVPFRLKDLMPWDARFYILKGLAG